jgi:hypothetical protein
LVRAFDASNGATLLDTSAALNFAISDRVSSIALSRDGSLLAAIAASHLGIFRRAGSGVVAPDVLLNAIPKRSRYPEHVVAVADQLATVYLVNISSAGLAPKVWTAPLELEDPADPNSVQVPPRFHSIAVSRASDASSLAVRTSSISDAGVDDRRRRDRSRAIAPW